MKYYTPRKYSEITRNTPRVQISPGQLTLWVFFTFKGIFVFFVVVQENNVFWKKRRCESEVKGQMCIKCILECDI